jgi:dimeric dUTPase (all-alpha-NTP-PPase superfamily)
MLQHDDITKKERDKLKLDKLFETQKMLDDRILEEHELDGQDLLEDKLLALRTEVGECANEWRGFKFWSDNTEANREPLLEEYVDGLHFILSIGIEIEMSKDVILGNVNEHLSVTSAFNRVYNLISIMEVCFLSGNILGAKIQYSLLINEYMNLGKLLRFDLNEIEAAYFNKNAVNHERQAHGY